MKRLDLNSQSMSSVIAETVAVLKAGGLVVYPTETTYGLGVDATNPNAVNKLLKYKSRRQGKPLSIAVSSPQMAEKFVTVNHQAQAICSSLLPGPVTVISKGLGKVAPGVESEFGSLGVRWSSFPLVTNILEAFGQPITATSANASGKARPYSIDKLLDGLSTHQKSLIDLVLDAGKLPKNPPSTVIDTTLSTPVVMRAGGTKIDVKQNIVTESENETKQLAGKIVLKHLNDLTNTGLVIGLDGELGTGKTIFAKGVAQFLQINQPITSPTYTYINQYNFSRHQTQGTFYHIDAWKVDQPELTQKLEIESLLKPNNVLVIEWFDQLSDYLEPIINTKGVELVRIAVSDDGLANSKRIFKIL